MTLTEFLLARIAEDEAAVWSVPPNGMPFDWEQYIGRYHPGRLLAECEAKRQIVEIAKTAEAGQLDSEPWLAEQFLQALALPYADHPDYNPEWRP